MTTVRTTSAADLDIAQCAQWFEQQQSNLGNDFLDAVEHARQEIAQHPLACPTLVLGDIRLKVQLRFLTVGRFSHIMFFEVGEEEIVVHGVAHPQRDLEALLRTRVGIRSY